MVRQDVLSAKLAELATRVARARSHCPQTADDLASDRDAQDIVAFNLMLAVQACADIASHIISEQRWIPGRTLGGSFDRLFEHSVISKETAGALALAAGLRNVVAHGYSGVDLTAMHKAAQGGLSDLEGFAQEVAAWAASHKGP